MRGCESGQCWCNLGSSWCGCEAKMCHSLMTWCGFPNLCDIGTWFGVITSSFGVDCIKIGELERS